MEDPGTELRLGREEGVGTKLRFASDKKEMSTVIRMEKVINTQAMVVTMATTAAAAVVTMATTAKAVVTMATVA